MAPGINLQNEVSQQISRMSLQHVDSQVEISQDREEQHKKGGSVEGSGLHVGDITSSPTGSSSGSIVNTEQQDIVKPVLEVNSEEINLAARALATTIGIEPTEEDIVKNSSSDVQDKVYRERETAKPRWITSPDTNYSRDKGGNHRMFLTYNRDNDEIRFFKDDDDFIVIKNDAIKSASEFRGFCSEIEKECEKKINEGEKYYYEDYLDDKGFIRKKVNINEIRERIESLRIELLRRKRSGGIQK